MYDTPSLNTIISITLRQRASDENSFPEKNGNEHFFFTKHPHFFPLLEKTCFPPGFFFFFYFCTTPNSTIDIVFAVLSWREIIYSFPSHRKAWPIVPNNSIAHNEQPRYRTNDCGFHYLCGGATYHWIYESHTTRPIEQNIVCLAKGMLREWVSNHRSRFTNN